MSNENPLPPNMTPGSGPGLEQPLSQGMTILMYALSFFFAPIAGIIIWAIYKGKPFESDRKVAKTSMIITLATFGLAMLCICGSTVLTIIAAGAGA